MKTLIFKGFWKISDINKMSDYIFLFGDNDLRIGNGGQAIIRGIKNTQGVRTKKAPSNSEDSFYTDIEYKENCKKIEEDFNELYEKIRKENYKGVVISESGLGTGLAELDKRAPKTFLFLEKKIEDLKHLDNDYLSKKLQHSSNLEKMLKNLETHRLENLKMYLDDIYHNTSEAVLDDYKYDILKKELENRGSEEIKKVGAKIRDKENRVNIPYWMGSADKITPKDPDKLKRWKEKNISENYVITEKLDGVSCLYVKEEGKVKLYTRGDGEIGADISYLVKYLKLPKINEDIVLRGELIMREDIFQSYYSDSYKNARNMISGLVGSKTLRKGVEHIDYVVYEIVKQKGDKQSEQLKKIKNLGFKIPNYEIINNLSIETLSELLTLFRRNTHYKIDGIIIQSDKPYIRNISGDPEYMFAYKMTDEDSIFTTTVKEIEWNISKWGQIKPVLIIEPVEASGITMSRATAHNAKYVIDNKLGKGAIIKITRSGDVIPYVVEIVKSAKNPDLPEIEYSWDKNKVNIISKKENNIMCIKLIADFFDKLKIKHVSEKTIEKLYNNGLDNLIKIVSATKDDILRLQIDGIEEKSAKRISDNIKKGLQDIKISTLLGSSGVLGFGIGTKKIESLFKSIPDILQIYKKKDKNSIIEMIVNVDGFSYLTAEKIVDNLKYADLFVKKMSKYIKIKDENTVSQTLSQTLSGKIFVITGTRDKFLIEEIAKRGGKITGSVSKKTTAVITDIKTDKKTGKLKDADKLEIPIYEKEQFVKEFLN